VEKSGIPLDIWKTANREYQVAARAAEFAERGIDRAAGNNLVSPTELLSGLAGGVGAGIPGGLAGGLATAAVRRHGSGTLNWLARNVRGLLEGGEGALVADGTAAAVAAERAAALGGTASGVATVAARASAEPESAAALASLARAKAEVTAEVDVAISHLLKFAPGAVGRTVAARISREVAEQARALGASPGLLQDALTRQVDELHGHAPNIAQATQLASARAAAFLASKAPAMPPPGLHKKPAQPSIQETSKFNRYAEVALRPMAALEHAKRGTLTPQHVASLRVVYPALYQHIQERLISGLLGVGGKTIPPQSRMMLSMLTGFRLDGSMGWNAIAANQAVYAQTAQPPPTGPTPNPNAEALDTAHRVRTPSQGLDARLNGGK
jgi:hypothetical protein